MKKNEKNIGLGKAQANSKPKSLWELAQELPDGVIKVKQSFFEPYERSMPNERLAKLKQAQKEGKVKARVVL